MLFPSIYNLIIYCWFIDLRCIGDLQCLIYLLCCQHILPIINFFCPNGFWKAGLVGAWKLPLLDKLSYITGLTNNISVQSDVDCAEARGMNPGQGYRRIAIARTPKPHCIMHFPISFKFINLHILLNSRSCRFLPFLLRKLTID